MFRKLITICFFLLFIAGCGTPKYTPEFNIGDRVTILDESENKNIAVITEIYWNSDKCKYFYSVHSKNKNFTLYRTEIVELVDPMPTNETILLNPKPTNQAIKKSH